MVEPPQVGKQAGPPLAGGRKYNISGSRNAGRLIGGVTGTFHIGKTALISGQRNHRSG